MENGKLDRYLNQNLPASNPVLLYIDASIDSRSCVEGNVDVEEMRSLHVASRETWPAPRCSINIDVKT